MSQKFKNVKCTVVIAAPPQKVFDAITVADQLAGWWPPAAETEPRPGGKVVLWWTKDTANPKPSNRSESTFSSFNPPHEVTYWAVTFTLESMGDKTKVTIDDKECPADDGIISAALTWGSLRLNLKSYVERGIDMRASSGFQGCWGE